MASKPSSAANHEAKRLTAIRRIDGGGGLALGHRRASQAITVGLVSSAGSPSVGQEAQEQRDPGLIGPQRGLALALRP